MGRASWTVLRYGTVDLGDLGIETRWDPVGLNVTDGPQEGEWIGVDVNVMLVVLGDVVRGDRKNVVVVLGGVSGRVEEGLYVGQVDEDAAGGRVSIDDGKSAKDALAVYVVYEVLQTVFVEERMVFQYDGTTEVGVGAVEYSILVVFFYGADGDGRPSDDLGASGDGDGSWTRGKGKKKESLLEVCGDGESEKGELGIIAFRLPSFGLAKLVSGDGDAGVLTESRGDEDGRFCGEEAVDLPSVGSVVDPIAVAFDDEGVEIGEVLKVELYVTILPVEIRWAIEGREKAGG
jgi:hypothetical protein